MHCPAITPTFGKLTPPHLTRGPSLTARLAAAPSEPFPDLPDAFTSSVNYEPNTWTATIAIVAMARCAPEDTDDNSPAINGHDASIYPVCAALAARVKAFLDLGDVSPLVRDVQEQTRVALGVINSALERYSLEELSLSYNGGKDCLVLLILLLASLSTYTKSSLPTALQSVYIISPHPFSEVDDFVNESVATYHLDLARYAMPMKQAFKRYLEEHGNVKAILVGTRRTDPHGQSLTHFDETDHGWPSFMRVHPVIDWHYVEIWTFIRHLDIPYCKLYDQGYTSLGGTTDTHPNPALKAGGAADTKDHATFRPAYELVEDKAERLGRDW